MRALVMAALLWAGAVQAAPGTPGTLVIAGGAVAPDNADVHGAFVAARPVGSPRIAIIPSASGFPATSAASMRDTLVRHGARAEDVVVVQVALVDDPDTSPMDESLWAGGADDPAEVAKVTGAGAIWFSGGDQMRTMALLKPGGRETPLLKAVRARLAAGAVVGGTSAGAAVMSDPMITDGGSLPALLAPVLQQAGPDNRIEGGPLVMGPGLGFFPDGLVDQHFSQRARLGRLARALFERPAARRVGFGIDEDTALVVDLSRGLARVAGRGHVTVLDARGATRLPGGRFGATGMRLSMLGAGDAIELATLAVQPGTRREPVGGPAGQAAPPPDRGGVAADLPPLATMLEDLLAEGGPSALVRRSFEGDLGVAYVFRRLPGSGILAGWDQESRRTSLLDIGFDIRPLAVDFRELRP
jgi:cyanophycinase